MKKLETFLGILLVILCAFLARDLWENRAVPITQETESETKSTDLQDGELPARYDGRDAGRAPTVKNQGTLGTCWAVAASSALEANLLPQQEIVFSADHLSLQNHFSKEQNDGGDYTMAMAYLAGWQGPVTEEQDPYGDGVSDDTLSPVCHVQEMQVFKERDDTAIKWAVYQYGAVQSSIYMDMDNAFGDSVYYNHLEYSYLYPGEESANHDVLIIGWDDDYPASGFNYNASGNGAFICQNSWGENFGESGVFYVSYEDVNIAQNTIAYTVLEDTENYGHLYQSDLCGWVGQVGYGDEEAYFACVYEATGEETLEAVGFYATGKNTEYEISVIGNFEDSSSFMGREILQKGNLKQAGYYTVKLLEAQELSAGERFAVAVRIKTPGAQYPIAVEYAADEATQAVAISDGEGYISHTGVAWASAEEEYSCNLCLKAYTTDR